MNYIIGFFIIVIFLVFLSMLSRFFVRPIRMKRLALKMGLNYKKRDKFITLNSSFNKNIISGSYRNKKIEIYDHFDNAYGNYTITKVDDKEVLLQSLNMKLVPVDKLKDKIDKYLDSSN